MKVTIAATSKVIENGTVTDQVTLNTTTFRICDNRRLLNLIEEHLLRLAVTPTEVQLSFTLISEKIGERLNAPPAGA